MVGSMPSHGVGFMSLLAMKGQSDGVGRLASYQAGSVRTPKKPLKSVKRDQHLWL